MTSHGYLVGWIEERGSGAVLAAYVGAEAGPDPERGYSGRTPAMCFFRSIETARQWVTSEAEALGLSVRWASSALVGLSRD